MNQKPDAVQIFDGIEITIIGNLFALLIVCGGLLGGSMVAEFSFAYWRNDIVPLCLMAIVIMRLLGNGFDLYRIYLLGEAAPVEGVSQDARAQTAPAAAVAREKVQGEHVTVAQLPEAYALDPEKVVEEVARRIESQRNDAIKKNKFINK